MSSKARLALGALVILSFAGSAGLLIAAGSWLHDTASAGTLIARAAGRLMAPHPTPSAFVATEPACDAECDGDVDAELAGATFFTNDDDELPFAVIDGGSDFKMSLVMSHETPGLRRLLRDRGVSAIWFERDGSEYAIRDAEACQRAHRIVEPMESLGRAMGELGGRMGQLGAHQGRLGGELGRLGGRLARLETQRVDARSSGDDERSLAREIREVRADMDRVREQMDRSGERTDMNEARSRMHELRDRHQAIEKRVREQMRSLIEESLRNGRAQRLDSGV